MMKILPQKLLLIALLGLVWGPTVAESDEPFHRPVEGVLLLANGNVLRGMITQEGGHYVCAVDEKSLIRIPDKSVQIACRDMQEAYDYRKSRLAPLNLSRELDLLEWTLKVGMLDMAAIHLGVVSRSEPDHPRVQQLGRRYEVAVAPKPEISSTAAMPAEPHGIPEFSTRETEARLVDSLHPSAVQYFTGTVQPLLLNGCSATTCHGQSTTTKFQLTQFDNIRSIPRRLTLQNMESTLRAASEQSDSDKKFLEFAARAHGARGGKALEPNQLAVLQFWLRNTVQKRSSQEAVATQRQPPNTGVRPVSFEQPISGSAPPQSPMSQPSHDESAPSSATPPGMFPLEDVNPVAEVPKRGEPAPRDAFDPEIFNRKYHPSARSE
ncbi:MAG: hypothetical protein WD045_15045 [Pirellulaceae bacterium]